MCPMSLLRLYAAWLKLALLSQAQYRVSLIFFLIHRLIEPLIYLAVWSAVARASGGTVGSYDSADFANYFIVSLIVNHLTYTWHITWYDYLIRSGDFSILLLRPVHPIHSDIADNFASKLLTISVMLPTIILLLIIYQVQLQLTFVLPFLIAVCLAFVLRFSFEYLIGLLAFWTTRLDAINQLYYTARTFLSGKIAPIPLLPIFLQSVTFWLPFYWMFGFPIDVLVGKLDRAIIVEGMVMQITLIAMSIIGIRVLWRIGIRRYTAVGS
jgi:ABC-2 type transport system permease protein